MNRQEKAAVIESLQGDFTASQAAFLIGFKGLSVKQVQTLRKQLRTKGGSLKVAKARLMKRAAEGLEGSEHLLPFFKNQIGVVFAEGETQAIAKVLTDFAKENEALSLVVGYLDASVLDHGSITRIASLPPKEVLLAQLCGTVQAPVVGFANVLNVLLLRLLWTLKQVGDKKQ